MTDKKVFPLPEHEPEKAVERLLPRMGEGELFAFTVRKTPSGFEATYYGPWRAVRAEVVAGLEELTVSAIVDDRHPLELFRTGIPVTVGILTALVGFIGLLDFVPGLRGLFRMSKVLGIVALLLAGALGFFASRLLLTPLGHLLAPSLARRREARHGPESEDAARADRLQDAFLRAAERSTEA